MIITVTCNPALDKTACIDRLRPHTLHRLTDVRQDAGGKGINVSRCIAALGGRSLACGFTAGESGLLVQKALEEQGVPTAFLELPGHTRTNLKLVEPDGSLTEFNEPGPAATPADTRALAHKLEACAAPGTLFVLAGSVGPGVPADYYASLTARLKARGARVLVDADGPLLTEALQGDSRPDCLKPNLEELARCLGCDPQAIRPPALPALVRPLLQSGVGMVCVSLGAQGAALFAESGAWYAPALPVAVRSAVGAGDAMTAALAYGMDRALPAQQTFRLAMAAAAAACSLPGTQPPDGDTVRALQSQVALQALGEGQI